MADRPVGQLADDRRWRRLTTVAIAAGAIWRLGRLALVKWHQPLLFNDSVYYSEQAKLLTRGLWYREVYLAEGLPGAEHGPLTSTLLAPVTWVHDPVPWQRLVTTLCGIATVWVLARLARELAGARAGALAAVVAAAAPGLWVNDGLVMSESPSMLVISLGLWSTAVWWRTRSRRSLLVTGAIFGLAGLARSEALLLLILFGLVVVVEERRDRLDRPSSASRLGPAVARAAAAVGVGLVVVAPWVAFNLSRFERPVYLSTNDGTTLLGANCPASYHGPGIGGWAFSCLQSEDPIHVDLEEPSVRADRRRDLGLRYARAHERELPRVVAARIGRSLSVVSLPELVDIDVGDERARWSSWAAIVGFWVMAPLTVVALARGDRRTRTVLVLPIIVVAVATVAFYGGHRIRSTEEPALVVGAALAIDGLLTRRDQATAPSDPPAPPAT